jgi:integrase
MYLQCAADLAGEIPRARGEPATKTDRPIVKSEEHLGARHCPTLVTAAAAVTTLRDRVSQVPKLQLPKSQEEQEVFIRHHNDLTLYTYWMFAFTTGIRAVVHPYPRIESVDLHTGILTIEDKRANSGDPGYKRRLVWLPPVVRQQMQAYRVYLDELKRKYKIASEESCFFLSLARDEMRPVSIRPLELQSRVEALLPYPTNIQRLFLRSELLERGCGAEVVDAFMGHWSFGEEPWAPFSTFNYAVYFSTLKGYLVPLLLEMGFDVVRRRILS